MCRTHSRCTLSSSRTRTLLVGLELLAAADERAGGESGVGTVDAVVAAVADLHGEPVLTDNVGDFDGLGVRVERY